MRKLQNVKVKKTLGKANLSYKDTLSLVCSLIWKISKCTKNINNVFFLNTNSNIVNLASSSGDFSAAKML